jgi:Rieske Fe-S protein
MTEHPRQERRLSRRHFFEWMVWIIGGLFSLLLGIPLVGSFISPLLRVSPAQFVPVASLDQIDVLQPRLFVVTFLRTDAPTPYREVRGVFVIRKGEDILAFTNTCTHMACSVRWLDWRDQILCPCHGGIFDRWGNLVGGPPPFSLPFFVSKIENNVLFVANRLVQRAEVTREIVGE